ncbi:Ribosomal-protein-S18p-alanine acetyltransferase [Streptococcus sp. DD10]|uniref:ribosomal protein S18-alanine N-acetyltransferase n=1 Tax=Streptococcus sp. DD10 TaxID=1777878 RepID=UPI00079B1DB7|nr:ribosomal protein S18-alanine N-acetyltransferase [Streptococcus sp. DD10]KXT72432.1 Ribosomal-protein-S18p-alanine acetyltransferase [Streptococcus sp. DD10]
MIEIQKLTNRPDLANEIWEVMEEVYTGSPWSLAQIQADLSQQQTTYIVAFGVMEIIGFLAIQETDLEVEVLQVAVKKAFRRQGIAKQLFANLPTDKDIFLEVRESNQPALLFYKKEKFKEITRRKGYYYDPVEDAVIMKRDCNER